MARGTIYIGTSGWHYPHWIGPFYPAGMTSDEFLPYYVRHFSTVELNTTFYHLPLPTTIKHWDRLTPETFRFACKGNRFITHMKKLKNPQAGLSRFFEAVLVLEHKLGPILFQLPPHWKMNASRLEAFLKALHRPFRYAFEFRDGSWFDSKIYQLLTDRNAAFCVYHLAGQQSPEIVTADFMYVRLHGPDGPYQGNYSDAMLHTWADKCQRWSGEGKDVYCYFDNDEGGYAPLNALALKQKIRPDLL